MLKHLSWQVYLEWMGMLAVAWYCWFVVRFIIPGWKERKTLRQKDRAPISRADYFPEQEQQDPLKDD